MWKRIEHLQLESGMWSCFWACHTSFTAHLETSFLIFSNMSSFYQIHSKYSIKRDPIAASTSTIFYSKCLIAVSFTELQYPSVDSNSTNQPPAKPPFNPSNNLCAPVKLYLQSSHYTNIPRGHIKYREVDDPAVSPLRPL